MKILIALLIIAATFGCASVQKDYQDMLNKIPHLSAEEASYSRQGIWTSASISAIGGKKTFDAISFEAVSINLNYFFEKITILLRNYRREFKEIIE